jgi:hypothetical protein
MGAARPETAGTGSLIGSVVRGMSRLTPWSFAVLFAAFFFSSCWIVINVAHTTSRDPSALESSDGISIGRDFNAFYSASVLTLKGEAANAYDHSANRAVQQQVTGAPATMFPWFYPPVMFLIVAPLALFPYFVAFALWVLAPLAALALAVRRYAGHILASATFLVFPGTVQSLLAGQNGVLSASILVGGLIHLERKPLLAGAILGLLSYKPHIAATVYAALLFGRHWRALGAAIGVALALAAASLFAFGLDAWLAFFRETETARAFMENGQLRWTFMATVLGAARLAGADVPVAYALQAVVTCGALWALFAVWRRDIALEQRAAVLAAVIPLMTPYVFSYDLPMLGLTLLWLAQAGWATGFRRGESVVLAAAWVIAPVGWVVAEWSNVLLTPLVIVALLCVLLLRICRGADQDGLRTAAASAP